MLQGQSPASGTARHGVAPSALTNRRAKRRMHHRHDLINRPEAGVDNVSTRMPFSLQLTYFSESSGCEALKTRAALTCAQR